MFVRGLRAAVALLYVVVAAAPGFAAAAAPGTYSADAVKAAYLFRFCGYVGWPARDAGAPLVIGVVGADAVADALGRLSGGQSVDGRRVVVRSVANPAEAADAAVLYVGGPAERLGAAVKRFDGRSVLVVGDDPGALDAGAAIAFVLVENRVRFAVSLTAASRAGITLRAPLLSVAHRVEGRARAPDPNAPSGGTPPAAPRDGGTEYSIRGK